MRVGFAGGGEAEGDGHYFCFAEEESVGGGLVCGLFDKGKDFRKEGEEEGEEKNGYLLSDNCVRTSLRYVLRMLWTLKT